MRPCTGAIIVLVFALSQGLFSAGIASALVMGIGTGLTVATLAGLIPVHCTSDLVCARRVEVIEWRAGAMPKGAVVAALQIRQDYTPSELRRRAAAREGLAIANALAGMTRAEAATPGRDEASGSCAMPCCASTGRDLTAFMTDPARVVPSG
jgi:hypothetical protein